jgi:hypothetical protein
MGRKLKNWMGVVALVVMAGAAVAAASSGLSQEGRSDIIVLDSLRVFGSLERPPVYFRHDRHTAAVGQLAGDCRVCHAMDGERMAFKFRRTEDADRQTVMKIYHDGCIACHKEGRAQRTASGPITCGGCHVRDVVLQSNHQPIGMDRSLHYLHTEAVDGECGRCHHQYDPERQELFHAPGEEESCLYCHNGQGAGSPISMRKAAHRSCIECHLDYVALPVECSGCHGPEQQAQIQKVEDPARMGRNQPDATMIRLHGRDEADPSQAAQMARVPFNHKVHEKVAANCRTCHHAALTPCADCHSLQSRPEGADISLEQAMHRGDAIMSCVGCHNKEKMKTECAGCHAAMAQEPGGPPESACEVCHMPANQKPHPQDDGRDRKWAADLLVARQTEHPMADTRDIPDVVTIDHLVNHFEPVRMPHRLHALTLVDLAAESLLASAFHAEPATLCTGCHHHSPPSLTPPRCGECHGRTAAELRAAFHGQCFQCHTRMEIAEPSSRDCTACHARRKPASKEK